MYVYSLTFFYILSYSITGPDIFRGVNDTTSSALMTGMLISGYRNRSKGTCYMHMQELALHHALGTRTRSQGGVEIDNFPPGRNLRQRVKNLLSYIMDKKSKKRFVAEKDVVRSHFGKIPVALELPNDTWISGSF
jgi:hypothetical protein